MFPARSVAIILICAEEVSSEFTVRWNTQLLLVHVVMIVCTHHHWKLLLEYSILNEVGQKFCSVHVFRLISLYAVQVWLCR